MKKRGLLKAIGICFIIAIVLSWFIPTGGFDGTSYTKGDVIAFGPLSLIRIPVVTTVSFMQIFVVLCSIGLFYGVLNKTQVYYGLVSKIADKWKGKEKALLIIITIFYALFASVTANYMLLIALTPFISALLLKVKYDKKSALLATIGAMLVGGMASTFGLQGSVAQVIQGYGAFANILQLSMMDSWGVRVILFIMLTGLYLFFVVKKSKLDKPVVVEEKKTRGRKTTKAEEVKEEVENIPFLEQQEQKKHAWPLVLISLIFLALCSVSMYYWHYAWNVDLFSSIYNSITSFKIGNFAVYKFLIDGISTFGLWNNYDFSIVLIFASLIISFVYGVKFKDYFDGAVKGIKKMLPVAFIATVCNVIFYLMVSNQTEYLSTIVNFLSFGKTTFSLVFVSISTLVGSFFYNDLYYLLTDLFATVSQYDAVYYPITGIVITALHGLAMMILPTSIYLLVGLGYFDVSFKEWFKTIWTFLIEALVVIILVAIVIVILI